MQKAISIFYSAITNHQISRLQRNFHGVVRVISQNGEHIGSRRGCHRCTCSFFLLGERAAEKIFCGAIETAFLHQQVCATKAQPGASRIADAVFHQRVEVSKARNTVVTRIKFTVLYTDVFTASQVDPVMSALYGHSVTSDIFGVVYRMGPVARIGDRIA